MGPATPLQRRTRVQSPRMTDGVRCEACGSGDAAEDLPLCGGCERVLHIFCLRPILPRFPADSWFCPSCSSSSKNKRPKDIRLIEVMALLLSFQQHPKHLSFHQKLLVKVLRRLLWTRTMSFKTVLQNSGSMPLL